MSSVLGDGTLRLDLSTFQALVDGTDASNAIGAPGVAAALGAVRSPTAVAALDVVSRRVYQRHRIWAGEDTAAMLLAVSDQEHQLMALPHALLPTAVARVVRLGPRKTRHPGPLTLDFHAAADLFAEDDLLRTSAFEGAPWHFAWNLGLSEPEGHGGMCVLDGPRGTWAVTGDVTGVVLEPTTATELWRRLTRVLLRPPDRWRAAGTPV